MNSKQHTKTDLELLGYPFDQYQRYQDIRLVLDTIQSQWQGQPLKILDVGGSPITSRFLFNYAVLSANVLMGAGVQLQCDGSRLPLADGSFDAVITVDTLEHVPEVSRAAFIHELVRVSSSFVIITGPFANGYNEVAEKTLNDFLVNVVGSQHWFLTEHLENGLPDLDTCLQVIARTCESSIAIPSGYIHHWLPLMIIKYDLTRIAGGQDISDELDRFYNYACYWSDHRLPSYRQVVVASKRPDPDTLASIQRAFQRPEETLTPDLNGVVAMWQALRWHKVLQVHADALARLRAENDSLRAENQRLNALVAGYASGRFIRFMAAMKQLRDAVWKK
jgi:hypothetical protein